MATLAPSALVIGPARAPIAFGLGSVFTWRNGDRFESGITWDALTCEPAQGRGGPACAPDVPIGLPKVLTAGPEVGEATAFVVWGEYACSPIGGGWNEAQERANAHLAAREEARAERAFYTGDLGNVPNLSGANGYPAPLDEGAFDEAHEALAAVEQGIAREYGSLGTIHVSIRAASLLLSKGSLVARGGRLFTELGTPVVAGAGYPDLGEIVGTGALVGYRSEVFNSSSRQGDLLNRATNDLVAIAERSYVVGFDPCPVVRAGYGTPPVPLTTLSGLNSNPATVTVGQSITVTVDGDGPAVDPVHLFSSTDNGTTWNDEGVMS